MLLTAAILAGVGWIIFMLVLACLTQARQTEEAHEELEERIRLLHEVVSSVGSTGSGRVQAMRRRSLPFREILSEVPDVAHRHRQ